MSNELERFIKDNREDFDGADLPGDLWSKIEKQMQPPKKSLVIPMRWVKMAAAAAVIIAVGLITLKTVNTNKPTAEAVAGTNGSNPVKTIDTAENKEPLIAKQSNPDEDNDTAPATTLAKNENKKEEQTAADNTSTDDELFHFTKLIEIKQKQIQTIKHDSPELYDHFVADYNKLDKSYNELKEEMKTNPNKEVLLEKMIANLQLQIGLLNEQLKVVHQLNKLKKEKADEISKSM